MKYLVYILFLSMLTTVWSQEEDNYQIPDVVPVSPEAASLGKYGDVPVNLATGKINYSVPLHTIKVKDFEWPIYLSYNYDGLKTEVDPPMTGLGWDLMASGRITREVRGMPDEIGDNNFKTQTMIPYLKGEFNSLTGAELEDIRYGIYQNVSDRAFDAQQDKYNISTNSISGSYVNDTNGEAIFIVNKNYNVNETIVNDDKQIIVTDDKGIKYHFDESEISQHTYSIKGESVENQMPLSYLLTRIELINNGGNIYFEYDLPYTYQKQVHSESRTIGTGVADVINLSTNYSVIQTKPLKKITFPNGEIVFNTSSGSDNGLATFVLNEMTVFNNISQIQKYSFAYDNPLKSKKTLVGITKETQEGNLHWYDFQYHSAPSSINYKQQDLWGYYNAKGTSELLLDTDRGVSFNATRSGALHTITHPTKGTTEIQYEQNVVPLVPGGNSTFNCTPNFNQTITKTFESNGEGAINFDTTVQVPGNQVIEVFAYVDISSETNGGSLFGAEIDLQVDATGSAGCTTGIIDFDLILNGEEICGEVDGIGSHSCPESHRENESQTAHTGNGDVRIQGVVDAPIGIISTVYVSVRYESTTGTPSQSGAGGIRVSQTKDCDGSSNCIIKNYKYIKEDGMSSGALVGSSPLYTHTKTYAGQVGSGQRTTTSVRSFQDFSSFQSSPVLYSRVETIESSGGNGKIVDHFSSFSNGSSTFPFIPVRNNDWKKGVLLKKEVFEKEGGIYIPLKEIENVYDSFYPYGIGSNATKIAYGMAVDRDHFDSFVSPIESQDYKENYYEDVTKEYKVIKTIEKNFLDGEEIIQETEYSYDTPNLQLETVVVNDSKQGEFRTDISYPYSITGPAHDELVDQNRISERIQNITTLISIDNQEKVLNTQKTYYKDLGSGIVVPYSVLVSKGNGTIENRLVYDEYDGSGNLLQVSKLSGPKHSFIWGYNGELPVAKIENATFSQIEDILGDGFDLGEQGLTSSQVNSLRTGLPYAMVSTYNYDPLIGVTSMTDPRGYTIYYEYDEFNRLKEVRDADGNLVTDYEYNYKSQF